VYAKVVNVDSRQDASILSAEFVMMDDMIRDELIRFVFEREREILREKRG
jgi:c-di-GMP-binding flagellar brake protein YcgR